MVAQGPSAVDWQGVGLIAASWVVSPIVTGVLAAVGFAALRAGVLRSDGSLQRSFMVCGVGCCGVWEWVCGWGRQEGWCGWVWCIDMCVVLDVCVQGC